MSTDEIWNTVTVHYSKFGNEVSDELEYEATENFWFEYASYLEDDLGMDKHNTVLTEVGTNETGGIDYTLKFKENHGAL